MPSPTVPLSGEKDTTLGAAGATVSTVTVRAAEAALTLPATSTAFEVKAWLPSARVPVANVQAPLALAVAVPIWVAPSNTSTVLPATAVPARVRWLASVMPSPTVPLSGEKETTLGAAGATVSTVTVRAAEAVLTLPATSTAFEVKAWLPSARVPVANVQAPLALAVAVPIWVAPSNTSTVLPATAVPARVRWLASVMPSPTVPLSGEKETTLGAAGATVSTVTVRAAEAVLTLPATSTAFEVKAWLPSARVPVANVQAPLALAVAVPIWVAPSNTSTVLPATAVPARVRWLASVMPSPTVPLSGEKETTLGAAGATVSTVTVRAAEAVLTLPATSTAFEVKAWLPSARVPVANVQAPLALAVAVPIWVAPSNTSTVLPATAVPARVRWLASVMPSPTVPLSGEKETTLGAAGATVSTVTVRAAEAVLTLPATSTAFEVRAWLPSARVPVANVQAPLALAVAVPIWVAPSNTSTVLPATAVPARVRWLA